MNMLYQSSKPKDDLFWWLCYVFLSSKSEYEEGLDDCEIRERERERERESDGMVCILYEGVKKVLTIQTNQFKYMMNQKECLTGLASVWINFMNWRQ